ncbi:LacI family DNA-binding transcriptional regulator [Thermomonas aquatica]|uniref:Substrate-binding domain-containing protein n=1 Tax=Thermomonas aquatica TaxID=2202149 RepID=A0A5B7ZSQ6_9GAMM|nr:LacI family DNA-binding transcriptional regulator [Thermomonas aquatica]QDA58211.1 substrate-binding domain-containing protein [Thermomonas aquatica]
MRPARPNRERKITVNDVALASGVSRATVSLVLRGSPLVHAKTRERVERQIAALGYVYNRAAANLRTRTSSSVALIINDLSNPFFAEFAMGVGDALVGAGHVALLGSTGESVEWQEAVLGSLMEHSPAGIILSPAEHTDGPRLQRMLGHEPVVVFNREIPGTQWDFLALDNRNGARLATEHLLSLGHRRIAFFGGHADSSSCQERRQGYLGAMDAAGVAADPRWLVECAPNRVESRQATRMLFQQEHGLTAAVCYNDNVALGFKLGLMERGLRPGLDFALTGFDDIPEAAQTTPALTTLAVDPRERGRQAAELLLERVRDPDAPVRRVIAPVRLVVRDSSGTPLHD